jgi:hypothetical protein
MRSPAAEQARRESKPLVDAWITRIIDTDLARGRSQHDFRGGDVTKQVRSLVPDLNAKDFDVYQGGGNIFQVRYSEKGPTVVQVRPFAQRTVRLRFT